MNSREHQNYVIEFNDGTCKVGVTSRGYRRVRELCAKVGHPMRRAMFAPRCSAAAAFKTERELCRLLSYRRKHGREWFLASDDEFFFLTQTTGMFWHLNVSGGTYQPEFLEA